MSKNANHGGKYYNWVDNFFSNRSLCLHYGQGANAHGSTPNVNAGLFVDVASPKRNHYLRYQRKHMQLRNIN